MCEWRVGTKIDFVLLTVGRREFFQDSCFKLQIVARVLLKA